MEKVTRKSLTLDKKLEIIHKLQNGSTNAAICAQYKLTSSTVSTVWKNREKYVNVQHVNSLKIKRLRESKHPNVDKDLLKWFSLKRSENVPITGNILKEKATELKRMCEDVNPENDVEASGISRGWLDRFKRRYNISSGKFHGESASVSCEINSDWINTVWPNLCQKYNKCDIFNGDEMDLCFKMTPDKPLKFKREPCSGGKVSKEKLTVFVCANMDGSEKKKLVVIGKSASPRCFKDINVNNLPVTYFANGRAWMTSDIFKNILEDWDKSLHDTNRKILLLIDNCPAHSKPLTLRNIEVVFLPPNVTATLQPMDQGIIPCLKVFYKQQLLKLVHAADDNVLVKVTVLDAIMMLVNAWQQIDSSTILNYFRHSGLLCDEFDEDELPLVKWIELQKLRESINNTDMEEWKTQSSVAVFANDDLNDFGSAEDDLVVADVPCKLEILSSECGDEEGDEIDMSKDQKDLTVPTAWIALDLVDKVNRFVTFNNVGIKCVQALHIVQTEIQRYILESRKQKQTKITDFFIH